MVYSYGAEMVVLVPPFGSWCNSYLGIYATHFFLFQLHRKEEQSKMDVSSDLLSLSSASPLSSIFIISPLFAFQTHGGGNVIMSYAYLLVMSHYIKPSPSRVK